MNVGELAEQLERIRDAGLGHLQVYSAQDYEQASGFHPVSEAEVRSHAMFVQERMPWDKSLPKTDLVVLW